jgi:hypothetical protein
MKFFIVILLLCAPLFVGAAVLTEVYVFVSKNCAYCEQVTYYLDNLKKSGAPISVHRLEISDNSDNLELFQRFSGAYDYFSGSIPAIFIGDRVISGFYPEQILAQIKKCSATACIDPQLIVEEYNKSVAASSNGITLPGGFLFGAIALASIIGIGFLSVARKR